VAEHEVDPPDWATAVSRRILGLRAEHLGWREIGRRLHLPPGKVYLIGTGRPADGGHALSSAERAELGDSSGPMQDLVNPPAHNPTTTDEVHEWLRRRAARELTGAPHA
jgi:protoporphyrinogen oxidase